MEFFSFDSENSSAGSNCQFSQDHTSDLMDNFTLSSASPYDFIPLDLSSFQQGFMNIYESFLKSINKQNVGMGILAAAAIYVAWKAGSECNASIPVLKDATSKLDDVKFRLKVLENDKELLVAEIDVRKQMIYKLQNENSSEREKRQQAELKMEMMSIENSQIRQLKKDIASKSCQVDRLEKLMSEKDDLQMKLFSDNVVLPRNVAEARAKEFGELQNRVHQLQAEIDSIRRFREFDLEYQPCRLASSVWLEGDSLSLPAPHRGEISALPKKFPPETSLALPESIKKKLPNTKLKLADRSPKINCHLSKPAEKRSLLSRRMRSPSLVLPNKTSPDMKCVYDLNESRSVTNESRTSHSDKTDDLTDTSWSAPQKNFGTFSQIRALIGGFRDNTLDSDPANLALLKELISLLNRSRANTNFMSKKKQLLSDKQSNAFVVGDSDGSDTDHNQICEESSRKSLTKKVLPLKRLSRYRRDKRKDYIGLKRRLSVQYYDGQARLIGLGEAPTPRPTSREHIHALKKYPLSDQTESCMETRTDRIISNQNSNLTLKGCEENAANKGNSWILMLPKDT